MATSGTLLVLFLLANLSLSSISLPSDSDKVSVDFYYESLCPYCANFTINHLAKLFEDDLISIVDLRLIPWGNAKIRADNTIDCQHGPYECLLNTVEACAIHAWPELSDHFPFINCVETLAYEHKYLEWDTCFQKLGLDSKLIDDCYRSGLGKELELKHAVETNNLQPPHKYVPWVVVDGQPLYEDYENYLSYVCKAYKGTSAISACSSEASLNKIFQQKSMPPPVCYKETTVPSLASQFASAFKSWTQKMVASM